MIYTGDIKIQELDDGSWDIVFTNGQPEMTNGLETLVIMAVFGEDSWINDIVENESEKMKSTFPELTRRANVTDETVNNGIAAINRALKFMTTDKIAKNVDVIGEIYSVYGIAWEITIESITDETVKFFINWEKGELTAQFVVNSA